MQTHPLNLTAAAPATSINISGRAFRYLSGTSAGDSRIIVKPENGNEMELKPGQGFKLGGEVGRWFVKSVDGASEITGTLNIGSGEFEDNNVLLSGTVSTNATVVNQPTVNLAAGSKVQEEIIAYTGSYAGRSNAAINTAVVIVTAAANVNGITVNFAGIEDRPAGEDSSFLAKEGAVPASPHDGDILLFSKGVASPTLIQKMQEKIKIPAGRGLYFIANHGNGQLKYINYTVH